METKTQLEAATTRANAELPRPLPEASTVPPQRAYFPPLSNVPPTENLGLRDSPLVRSGRIGDKEKFYQRVNCSPGCWLWLGYCDLIGYGIVGYNHKLWKAHRFAWFLENGPIPSGMKILHRCDVRNCVRIDHLFLGTQLDNVRDCKAKGRSKYPPKQLGEINAAARLTTESVKGMREMRSKDGTSYHAIAKLFQVSAMTVYRAINRQSWTHVP